MLEDGDWQAAKKYFKNLYKMTLVGDTKCGKSALMMRVSGEQFPMAYIPTIGVDFRTKQVICSPGEEIKLQIWDTAGNRQFQELVSSYTRGVAIMLMFDLTNRDSFENIRNYWIHDPGVRCAISSGKVILIGNKCDLTEDRVVSFDEARSLVTDLGIPAYLETSAKYYTRIDDAFAKITQLAMK